MKCSACRKEFDEGCAYCPWCGNKTTPTEEVTSLRRIAAEKKLKDLRRYEVLWTVALAICAFGAIGLAVWISVIPPFRIELVPSPLIRLIFFLVVLGAVCYFLGRRSYRHRQDLVKRLEKGECE